MARVEAYNTWLPYTNLRKIDRKGQHLPIRSKLTRLEAITVKLKVKISWSRGWQWFAYRVPSTTVCSKPSCKITLNEVQVMLDKIGQTHALHMVRYVQSKTPKNMFIWVGTYQMWKLKIFFIHEHFKAKRRERFFSRKWNPLFLLRRGGARVFASVFLKREKTVKFRFKTDNKYEYFYWLRFSQPFSVFNSCIKRSATQSTYKRSQRHKCRST